MVFALFRPDTQKSERFKGYLKRIYDFLKIQESRSFLDTNVSNKNAKKGKGKQQTVTEGAVLPELIVDQRLVDQEQIYQQLQLYNQLADSSMSVDSMTQFFSRCITRLDSLTMKVDTKAKKSSGLNGHDSAMTNGSGTGGGATTDNNPDDDADQEDEDEDFDDDEDEYEDEDELNGADDDDDDGLSDDSVGQLIKKSKKFSLRPPAGSKKSEGDGQEKPVFGIPDGSDSEISDFEVPQNGEEEDEEEEDDQEVDEEDDEDGFGDDLEEDEEDEEEDEEEEEGEMSLEMQKLAKERRAKKAAADDIDSDEVDEDLVDLYELGDEKEVMGIGKKAKSFDEVDFDDENFGFGDDDDFEDEEGDQKPGAKKGKKGDTAKKPSEKETSKDLFDVEDEDEDSQDAKKDELEGKSSFEIRQLEVSDQYMGGSR